MSPDDDGDVGDDVDLLLDPGVPPSLVVYAVQLQTELQG
jgi:hypothetical protein